jgi:hypothetical protein
MGVCWEHEIARAQASKKAYRWNNDLKVFIVV